MLLEQKSLFYSQNFLATWETLYNPNFKRMEFHTFRSEPGRLVLTAKQWISRMNAIGITSHSGRYGGTYAHKDIAFEFASWISPVFKLYLIKEFQRLKEEESNVQQLEWNAQRFLSKSNYLIQTDAIKHYIIPKGDYVENLQWLPYAEEADLLNVALFGFTAKAWRDSNPDLAKHSNVRDYASIMELTILSNLETHNAQMIREGKSKEERFFILKEIVKYQKEILSATSNIAQTSGDKGVE